MEIIQKRTDCIQVLIENGADVNFTSPMLKTTALHWLAYQGDESLVEILLDHGAIQKKNTQGHTPVDVAGFSGNPNIVKLFNRRNLTKLKNTAAGALLRSKTNQIVPHAQLQEESVAFTEGVEIYCEKLSRKDLTPEEKIEMRNFYWAAYYGMNKFVQIMIEQYRWSPFIKSYSDRSIVTGAIMGEQIETVRLMVDNYKYSDARLSAKVAFVRNVVGKDASDNNPMHYAYMIDSPEVREILRANLHDKKAYVQMNRRGQLPQQLRHYVK